MPYYYTQDKFLTRAFDGSLSNNPTGWAGAVGVGEGIQNHIHND